MRLHIDRSLQDPLHPLEGLGWGLAWLLECSKDGDRVDELVALDSLRLGGRGDLRRRGRAFSRHREVGRRLWGFGGGSR